MTLYARSYYYCMPVSKWMYCRTKIFYLLNKTNIEKQSASHCRTLGGKLRRQSVCRAAHTLWISGNAWTNVATSYSSMSLLQCDYMCTVRRLRYLYTWREAWLERPSSHSRGESAS